MKTMIHYGENGWIKGTTKIYEDGEQPIGAKAGLVIGIIGLIVILLISGLHV